MKIPDEDTSPCTCVERDEPIENLKCDEDMRRFVEECLEDEEACWKESLAPLVYLCGDT